MALEKGCGCETQVLHLFCCNLDGNLSLLPWKLLKADDSVFAWVAKEEKQFCSHCQLLSVHLGLRVT